LEHAARRSNPALAAAIMAEPLNAEQLAQRLLDARLLDSNQVESMWAELGTREVSYPDFSSLLLRKELITNFQLDRILKGEKGGYYYGDYKVLYLVGTGTFARVYRAVHTQSGRIVAVKSLRKRFRDDRSMNEQFVREGKIGMQLRHPNIVPIYEVIEHPSPALVMEFVEGRNLREFTRVRKKLSPVEAMRLTVDVLSGLTHAAHSGMTHRDLKMSNVLVTSRGKGKLVDFGLAGLQSIRPNAANAEETNPRTIDYAGLERASGVKNNDPRSDLFFVGVILYNMVCGVSPIGETKDRMIRLSAARYQNIKPILHVDSAIPPRLAAFVMRSLELNPEKRYATPSEMFDDAKRILARIEAGDTSEPDPAELAGKPAAAATADVLPDQEGQNKTLMVVESKVEMQDVLRDRLKKYGYRVLVFSDPRRAINRFAEDVTQTADCVIFCTQYLGAASLDAFNEFGSRTLTKDIPAVLFVDPKQPSLIKQAQLAPHRVMLQAPLKVRELREVLRKLLWPDEAPALEPADAPVEHAEQPDPAVG
jgi:serine/threonine protein kinase